MDMPDLSGPQLIADGGLTTELEAQARTRSVPRTYPSAAALIGVPMRAAASRRAARGLAWAFPHARRPEGGAAARPLPSSTGSARRRGWDEAEDDRLTALRRRLPVRLSRAIGAPGPLSRALRPRFQTVLVGEGVP